MEVDDDTLRSTDDDVMSAPLNNRSTYLTWPILGRPRGHEQYHSPCDGPDRQRQTGTYIIWVFPSIGYTPRCVSQGRSLALGTTFQTHAESDARLRPPRQPAERPND